MCSSLVVEDTPEFWNTGWLTRWSTRNIKTASASRENGFESVPEHWKGQKITEVIKKSRVLKNAPTLI